MPRTQEQFHLMQEESRSEIVQAALELFAEHGFARTSIAMIAKKASVSQGLMYNYYASKDALLQEIFERGWRDVQASFVVITPKKRTKPSLYDFIENTCRLTLKHQEFWRLIHSLRGQTATMERIGESIIDFERMILQQLETFCTASESPDPSAEARLLFALIDGICTHLVRQPETYPLDDVLRILKPQYQSRFF